MQPENQPDILNNKNNKTTAGNDFVNHQPNPAVDFHMGSDSVVNNSAQSVSSVESSQSSTSDDSTQTATTSAAPAAPKKKSKVGLIVTLCVATVVLVGGAIAGFLFLNWRNSPELAVLEAVTQSIQAKHVKLSGDITLVPNDSSEFGIKNIKINLASQSSLIPVAAQSSLVVAFEDNTSVKIDVDGAFMKDGTIYFKFSDFQNLLDQANLPTETQLAIGLLSDLTEEIDGEWYKFTVDDLDGSNADEIENFNCLSKNLSAIADSDTIRGEIADAYKKHPLFNIETTNTDSKYNTNDLVAYTVVGNSENATNFGTELENNDTLKTLVTCLEQFETQDVDNIDNSTNGKLILLVDKGWGKHELKGILMNMESDDMKIEANLRFEYPETLDIQAPADAKPFSSIVDSVEDAIMSFVMMSYCSEIPESDWESYGCYEYAQFTELED